MTKICSRLFYAHSMHPNAHSYNRESAIWEGQDLLSVIAKIREVKPDYQPSDSDLVQWKRGRGACSCESMSIKSLREEWLAWAKELLANF